MKTQPDPTPVESTQLSRRGVVQVFAALPAALLACAPSAAPSRAQGATPSAPRRVREVRQVVDAQGTTDGAGVRLRRSLGTRQLPMLDPFLMLDEFHSDRPEDYIAGFPSHPHRGFETVSYMIQGAVDHEDSLGNHGHLSPGSTQWMTAGRGIIHSEMPRQEGGLLWGFQLWVNLPRARKMVAPRYQDLAPERIVEATIDDARVRLVAGEAAGRRGPVTDIATAPQMLDVAVARGGGFAQPVPASHNSFAYVFEGAVTLGSSRTRVTAGQLAVLGPGERIEAASREGGRFLLLSGEPINEPVARSGPFVMNTDDELRQAWDDYRSGRLVTRG